MTTPSTDWKEVVLPDEEERFTRYAERLREMQRGRVRGASPRRALHAKGTAGVRAELRVHDDLPAHARAGLFAKPARYEGYARFSNGGGDVLHDRKGDLRGLAIKLVGVPGKKIIPGMEDETTQDFLFLHVPATPFRNPDEFIALVTAVGGNPLLLLPRLLGRLGIGRTFGLLGALQKLLAPPITSLATMPYYTATPIRFGDHCAQLSLMPHAQPEAGATRGASRDYLGEELGARLAEGPVSFDLAAQFFVDEKRTPVEDASVVWREEDAPRVVVGTLTLPSQDVTSGEGQQTAEAIEVMSFDPWHALVEHRPLGAVMRARNHAYRLSTMERKAAKEPRGA